MSAVPLTFLRHEAERPGDAPPLVIAHGLFGAARNWNSLARRFAQERDVIAVDLRNHGEAPWAEPMDYPAMAADLAALIEAEAGGRADMLGHSMGGKAAMMLALTAPERVRRLIVADMAPRAYDHDYGDYLAAMRGLDLSGVTRRSQADAPLSKAIPDRAMRAFILQNLVIGEGAARWRLNLDAIAGDMEAIMGWPAISARFGGETLFLAGGDSPYVPPEAEPAIRALFPAATIERIEGAGHWLHADKPTGFIAATRRFLGASLDGA